MRKTRRIGDQIRRLKVRSGTLIQSKDILFFQWNFNEFFVPWAHRIARQRHRTGRARTIEVFEHMTLTICSNPVLLELG